MTAKQSKTILNTINRHVMSIKRDIMVPWLLKLIVLRKVLAVRYPFFPKSAL
jgi:hypothetical protein